MDPALPTYEYEFLSNLDTPAEATSSPRAESSRSNGSLRRSNTPIGFVWNRLQKRRSDAREMIPDTIVEERSSESQSGNSSPDKKSSTEKISMESSSSGVASQPSSDEDYVRISAEKDKSMRGGKDEKRGKGTSIMIQIRPAQEADSAAIANLVNHYVHTSMCSLALNGDTVEYTKSRIGELPAVGLPTIVAIASSGLLGVIRATPICHWGRYEAGWNHSANVNIYVDHQWQERGIGSALMKKLIDVMSKPTEFPQYTSGWHPKYKYRCLFADMIAKAAFEGGSGPEGDEQHGSHAVTERATEPFFQKFGFEKVGTLRNAGWKRQTWLDVSIMQYEFQGTWQ